MTERKTGDIFITTSDRRITCFVRMEIKQLFYGGKSMIKKHLIVASMVIVSICSCLVVGKNIYHHLWNIKKTAITIKAKPTI